MNWLLETFRATQREIVTWSRGRIWLWRLPILLYLIYIGCQQFRDPQQWTMFAGMNLGIHEAGHPLFSYFGRFLHAAGGTILQLLFPCGVLLGFFKQRDYFGIAVALAWISTNLIGIGVYQADAERMSLELVTIGVTDGGVAQHDWRYLFTQLGLLGHCEGIATLTRFIGHVVMAIALALGGWMLYLMATLKPEPRRIIL